MSRSVFLSHAWAPDAHGRDTRARVAHLAAALRARGYRTWLDADEHLGGSLDAALARGVGGADAVLVCLTTPYCAKLDAALASPAPVADNCFRELALATLLRKPCVPVALEPALRAGPAAWGTAAALRLPCHVYASAADDPPDAAPIARALAGLFGGGARRGVVLGKRATRRPRRPRRL
jgi:hypothetical protein